MDIKFTIDQGHMIVPDDLMIAMEKALKTAQNKCPNKKICFYIDKFLYQSMVHDPKHYGIYKDPNGNLFFHDIPIQDAQDKQAL